MQADYKRFMDYTDHYHSDYMMKLRHIAEKTMKDNVFDEMLDQKIKSTILK